MVHWENDTFSAAYWFRLNTVSQSTSFRFLMLAFFSLLFLSWILLLRVYWFYFNIKRFFGFITLALVSWASLLCCDIRIISECVCFNTVGRFNKTKCTFTRTHTDTPPHHRQLSEYINSTVGVYAHFEWVHAQTYREIDPKIEDQNITTKNTHNRLSHTVCVPVWWLSKYIQRRRARIWWKATKHKHTTVAFACALDVCMCVWVCSFSVHKECGLFEPTLYYCCSVPSSFFAAFCSSLVDFACMCAVCGYHLCVGFDAIDVVVDLMNIFLLRFDWLFNYFHCTTDLFCVNKNCFLFLSQSCTSTSSLAQKFYQNGEKNKERMIQLDFAHTLTLAFAIFLYSPAKRRSNVFELTSTALITKYSMNKEKEN